MDSRILFVLSVLSLGVISCISEFDAKLPANDMQTLVVDGGITGNTEVTFHLSKSFPLDSFNAPAGNFDIDAKLTVMGSDGYQSPPATSMGKGEYRIAIGELNDDAEYKIRIEYDGDIYESSPAKPLHTPEIDSISWIQPEKYGAVSFHISTHDDTEGTKFFQWNYTEDWQIVANIKTTLFYDLKNGIIVTDYSAPYFYCWGKHISNRFLIGSTESLGENRIINKEFYRCEPGASDRFTELYCITVYQKSISKEAYEYYQNKIKLNEEMGGLFTPQPSELNGNITCITNPSKRVIGYVEVAKNMTDKRKWIERSQVTRWGEFDRSMPPQKVYTCGTSAWVELYKEDCIAFAPCPDNYANLYRNGYRPTGYPADGVPIPWAKGFCSDCTTNGGTKNKPDFWPNDHE